MAAHAMSSGELSLPAGGDASVADPNALLAEAPIHQLAEEIVRAALDIDPVHPDAERVRELVNAIAHPVEAQTHPFPSAHLPRRSRWVRRSTLAVAGLGLIAAAVLLGQASTGARLRASASPAVEASATTPRQQATASALASSLVPALLTSAFQDQVAGHADQATAAYLEVLKNDPANRTAEYNLGVIDQAANRGASAEEHYRAVLAVDPDFTPALFNLAILRSAAGANDEAAGFYRRILRVDPTSAPAHLNLDILLVQGGQQEAGSAELRQAVAIDPSLAWRAPAD